MKFGVAQNVQKSKAECEMFLVSHITWVFCTLLGLACSTLDEEV
jgi:hypothetical protein